MKFLVRKYYSGYCTYEIEADNEESAYDLSNDYPMDVEEIMSTLEQWTDSDEVERIEED